jgi:hypothetical protein
VQELWLEPGKQVVAVRKGLVLAIKLAFLPAHFSESEVVQLSLKR